MAIYPAGYFVPINSFISGEEYTDEEGSGSR